MNLQLVTGRTPSGESCYHQHIVVLKPMYKYIYTIFTQPNLCPTLLVLYATCVCLEKYKV